jgi:hypothetical protein
VKQDKCALPLIRTALLALVVCSDSLQQAHVEFQNRPALALQPIRFQRMRYRQ